MSLPVSGNVHSSIPDGLVPSETHDANPKTKLFDPIIPKARRKPAKINGLIKII